MTSRVWTIRDKDPVPVLPEGMTPDEVMLLAMEPGHGGIPGFVRRIRRILDVSQRGLAAVLGCSQSQVARWETGRTSPRLATVLHLLEVAGLTLLAHDAEGEVVEPMRDDGARDRGGRRHPAHVDLWARSWWTPPGSGCRADFPRLVAMSRERRQPCVTFHLNANVRHALRRHLGTPVDHPATHQLAVEVEALEERSLDARNRLERARAVVREWSRLRESRHGATGAAETDDAAGAGAD